MTVQQIIQTLNVTDTLAQQALTNDVSYLGQLAGGFETEAQIMDTLADQSMLLARGLVQTYHLNTNPYELAEAMLESVS